MMTAATSRRGAGVLRYRSPARRGQTGVGLIELMIAILISMILLFGLFSFVYGTRQTFTAQNQLAQLQDNERMAMTLLSSIIQDGGYFPNPTVSTAAQALPVSGNFTTAGQSIYGAAGPVGDQIWVRYVAGTTDGTMDCTGATNTGAASQIDINNFYINTSNQLVCQPTDNGVAGAAVPLVNGITGMTILYGVDTNADGSADQYLAASAMSATNWNNVVSVQLTLTFANPLTGSTATGTTTATTKVLTLTRIIDLLNHT
jgi:type IV pilus assembly protein PilW